MQAVLLDDGEQLQGHAAGALGSGLPLLYRRFAGVEVARKYRLADLVGLAQTPDILGRIGGWGRQARCVEIAHGCLGNRAHAVQRARRAVDRFEGIALIGLLAHHRSSGLPESLYI